MPEAARARSSGEPGPVLERSRCRRCFPLCRWALPLGARPLPSLGTVAPPRARPGWLPMGRGRCALGEKAFSSDPRGCLGVPNPPAVAPPRARSVACTAAFVGYGPPPRGAGGLEDAASFSRPLPRPAPPPSETGEDPAGPGRRFRPRVSGGPRRACGRAACACSLRPCAEGGEGRGGPSPSPARVRFRAPSGFPGPLPSPRGLQPGGKRLAAGTFRGRLALGGAFHWGRESRPGSDPGGRTEKDEGGFPSRLGARAARGWRGRAVQRRGALEGFSEGLVPQEGGRPASRASRGRPVRLWRWDPRAFSRRPVRAPGVPLSSEADLASPGRARALRPRVPRLARLPPSPPPLPAAAAGPSSSPPATGGGSGGVRRPRVPERPGLFAERVSPPRPSPRRRGRGPGGVSGRSLPFGGRGPSAPRPLSRRGGVLPACARGRGARGKGEEP